MKLLIAFFKDKTVLFVMRRVLKKKKMLLLAMKTGAFVLIHKVGTRFAYRYW